MKQVKRVSAGAKRERVCAQKKLKLRLNSRPKDWNRAELEPKESIAILILIYECLTSLQPEKQLMISKHLKIQ